MNEQKNPWDDLSRYFDTSREATEIPAGAADNILIAWPPIVNILETQVRNIQDKKAVDLGCGGGGFCGRLREMGFVVTGIDPSEGMIEVARRSFPEGINFILGGQLSIECNRAKVCCGYFHHGTTV